MVNANPGEKILWSIALPGFAQFLNGKLIKGIVFIFLEFLVNVQSNLNTIIIPSFHGQIEQAIALTNYQWLMFYPCLYLFAIWDAYRDAGGGSGPYAFLPFVFSAFLGTIGVVYSSTLPIFGVLWGPIFLPILFLIIGVGVGFIVKWVVLLIKGRTPV
ncbi:hypothetical protein [Bacillus alkalicellulosilyticus]|uniref:hypothetical protein n=1 Tax=Alkalihalobacterium alkalicellulosilyticum TaxID=1912214 RepID=UPI000997C2C4|nr:hypothetical protein [Bacillus alkalicellulosilyticus]